MALATQCPHCKTTFRVAHDQLKLRAGLVRCGSCKQIFNGIENLLRPEVQEEPAVLVAASETASETANEAANEAALGVAPAPAASEQGTVQDAPREKHRPDQPIGDSPTLPRYSPPHESSSPEPQDTVTTIVRVESASAESNGNTPLQEDPMLRMTLLDVSASHAASAETGRTIHDVPAVPVDPLDRVIDELCNRPLRQDDSEDDDRIEPDVETDEKPADTDAPENIPVQPEEDEPGFVKQARRRQRWQRSLRFFLATGSFLLLLAALAQGAYLFRDGIAARFPEIRPLLEEACIQIGCEIRLPAQIERVSIESDELTASATESDTFALSLVLRNRSTVPQAWPHIELTLNDSEGKAILRKVFTPDDYLTAAEVERGFAAGAEQIAQFRFSLSQVKAAGYRVYLFHP